MGITIYIALPSSEISIQTPKKLRTTAAGASPYRAAFVLLDSPRKSREPAPFGTVHDEARSRCRNEIAAPSARNDGKG
jgi:hypothetical protein